jgi:hypothetical protein
MNNTTTIQSTGLYDCVMLLAVHGALKGTQEQD